MKNKKFNIILIVLDGVRVDRLNVSKELIEIKNKGIFFSNMTASGPYTLISLYSILSGLYGSKNGVDSYFGMFKYKKDKCKSLVRYLRDNGYFTQANTFNDALIPKEDFDRVIVHDEFKDDTTKTHMDVIKEMSKFNKEGKNFFVFLHYPKVHANMVKNVIKKYDDFSEEYFNNKEKNIERYNGYVKEAGIYAGKIFGTIKSERLLDNSLIIFMSDHGVSNGERVGEKVYGSYLYDYTIKNFAVFINEELFEPREITNFTRSIDIAPTIMGILKIKGEFGYYEMQGKTLMPIVNGNEEEERVAYSETGGLKGPFPSPRKPNVKCARTNKWKLIHNIAPDTWELYNVEEDPQEKKNLIGKNLEIENKLKEELKNIIADNEK